MTRVLVIGSGMAGCSAAQYLKVEGCDVTVLEARDRCYGRTYTDCAFVDFPIERGGEFVHDLKSATGAIVHKLQLATVPWPKTTDTLIRIHGELLTMDAAREKYPAFDRVRAWDFERPALPPGGESFANYLKRAGFDHEQIGYFRRGFANACGDDPAILDAEQCLRDADTYSGVDLKLLGGYDKVGDYVAKGLDIRLHSEVRTIDWSNPKHVRVTTSGGKVHEADAAVITVPLGVLKAGSIQFYPELPAAKTQAMKKMFMASVNKMIFAFDQPIFEGNPLALSSAGNPPTWWSPSFGRTDTQLHVWTGFFAGPYARELLSKPPAQALALGLETLRFETGNPRLTPIKSMLVDWQHDPFARGGYSACLPGGAYAREELGKPTRPLFWAGEATAPTSTVHGAFDSGRRAAKQVLYHLA